jgi:hypothetical protein
VAVGPEGEGDGGAGGVAHIGWDDEAGGNGRIGGADRDGGVG